MRTRLTILAFAFCLSLSAQTPFLMTGMRFNPLSTLYRPIRFDTSASKYSSWNLFPYSGFSAGTGFLNGSSISAFSVPVGLELYHPLSNRVTAFAGVSVVPTLFSFSRNFGASYRQNGYGDINSFRFGVVPRLEMGLMYTNEEHTFSISGSFSVERGNSYYPYFPAQPVQNGSKR